MSTRRANLRLFVALGAIVIGALLIPLLAAEEKSGRKASGRPALVGIGKDLAITSSTDSNVEILGGSVVINAHLKGDVISVGGAVSIGPSGVIDGDLVSLGGMVRLDDGAKITGREYRLDAVDRGVSLLATAVKLSVLLVWLAVAVIVTLAAPREIRASSVEARANPLHTLTVGLVAFTSFILTAIVFSYLVPFLVGIPLLVLLGVFAILAKVYGMVVIFHAAGQLLFGARSRRQLDRRKVIKGDLAMVVLGILVLGLVRLVPVLGSAIWMIASLMGVGAALSTRFGRREPWFLALEPSGT